MQRYGSKINNSSKSAYPRWGISLLLILFNKTITIYALTEFATANMRDSRSYAIIDFEATDKILLCLLRKGQFPVHKVNCVVIQTIHWRTVTRQSSKFRTVGLLRCIPNSCAFITLGLTLLATLVNLGRRSVFDSSVITNY